MTLAIDRILEIAPEIVAVILLIWALIKYVAKAVKEKNWPTLLSLVTGLMAKAETLFADGAQKKQWVLAMVKAAADKINYAINVDQVSDLIDDLCDMSKKVNALDDNDKTGSPASAETTKKDATADASAAVPATQAATPTAPATSVTPAADPDSPRAPAASAADAATPTA
jgi:hypothetical protein